ncbi:hypothetical protein FQR65_LT16880 [Abscondita terminalis]|nr:hypothetical protein FQR65_LT16880 [Abscondita terminalis]
MMKHRLDPCHQFQKRKWAGQLPFNISSTTTSTNNQKYYVISNNKDMLGVRKGINVPQNSIFAYEFKFKLPTNQFTGTEQIIFFPIVSTGLNLSGSQNTMISNLGYLNSSILAQSPVNTISISNEEASEILVNHNVTNTPDGYQHIGVYVNPTSKQVGYTISPKKQDYKSDADDIRRKIANINEHLWEKNSDVETVFSGKIELTGHTETKRVQAEDRVRNAIKDILVENKCVSKVDVSVALMVDGLGRTIEFSV